MGTRFELTPIVICLAGKRVDALLDPARPELALFAAWAMNSRRGPEARQVVSRAVELAASLPAPLRAAQERAIFAVLSEPLLAFLRKVSMYLDAIPERPAARELRLFLQRQRDESEAKGKAKGKQEALLAVLAARGIEAAPRQRRQILACADMALLDAWIVAAATASSVSEVLAAEPPEQRAPKRRATPKRAGARRKPAA